MAITAVSGSMKADGMNDGQLMSTVRRGVFKRRIKRCRQTQESGESTARPAAQRRTHYQCEKLS
jgi:hypothetical protein